MGVCACSACCNNFLSLNCCAVEFAVLVVDDVDVNVFAVYAGACLMLCCGCASDVG